MKRAIGKILDVLFGLLFSWPWNRLPRKEIPEIKCSPTFWRFIDEKNELILNWNMSETIQFVDDKKLNKLCLEHLRSKYPDKSRIGIAAETAWEDIQPFISHIVEEHFDEIKLDIPRNVVEGPAISNVTVSGIKNIATDQSQMFRVPRGLISGDIMLTTVRTIPWDVVNILLKKEPAKCKQ